MIVYGPIPSRRLGISIGINNIPPKACSYSCIYCQLGRTDRMQVTRSVFYDPELIYREADIKIKQLKDKQEKADYFTFVPDGEPTLDVNLGTEIDMLKPFHVKTAVITNASLLWMDEVKEDLMKADWVSISLDAAEESTWRKIDRPHGSLSLNRILDGMIEFSKIYKGVLVTETMLVDGLNDSKECIDKIAEQLAVIQPDKAYVLVPTRPPAESGINRASKNALSYAVHTIHRTAEIEINCITGDESEEGFFITESIKDDLLSIASVHPVREDIIDELLKKKNADKAIISRMVKEGELLKFTYEGKTFYRKNIVRRAE